MGDKNPKKQKKKKRAVEKPGITGQVDKTGGDDCRKKEGK